MRICRTGLVPALVLALAATASADVTIKSRMTMQAMGQNMASEATLMIKGGFMRTDVTVNGMPRTSIVDLNGRRYIDLDPTTKTATVTSADAMQDRASQMGITGMTVDVKPTGDSRSIAGMTCDAYAIDITMPMDMGGQSMTMTMKGPSWSAKQAPGVEDFLAFMKMASDSGMFLVNPGQRGQAGAAEIMRKMAATGLPCASEFEVGLSGNEQMAAMMSQMGRSTMLNETVSVSTDALDAALFAIPDGYTVKTP